MKPSFFVAARAVAARAAGVDETALSSLGLCRPQLQQRPGVHFDELTPLGGALRERFGCPVFVAGDFNATKTQSDDPADKRKHLSTGEYAAMCGSYAAARAVMRVRIACYARACKVLRGGYHSAVLSSDREALALLLSRQPMRAALPEASLGGTPLHLAVHVGDMDIVEQARAPISLASPSAPVISRDLNLPRISLYLP